MATTIVKIDAPEWGTPVLAVVEDPDTGLVAPNAAGYVLSSVSDWGYEISITEACVGIYRIVLQDGDGQTVGLLYVWIEADDAGPYYTHDSYVTCQIARDAVSNASTALATYDPPTRAELTTDINSVLALVSAAAIRAAVGLASANLDTQLSGISTSAGTGATQTTAAAIRAAIGLASANLDTQLNTITTQTTAAAIRTALGLAAANLDTQLAAIVADTNELQADWTNDGRLDVILDLILERALLIGTASATNNAPVKIDNTLEVIWIGDDYYTANDRAFVFRIPLPDGLTIGSCSCVFACRHAVDSTQYFQATGTCAEDSDTNEAVMTVEMAGSVTTGKKTGKYNWHCTLLDQNNKEITNIGSGDCCEQVELRAKFNQ